MAHAQKPDIVLRRDGRVHLNRRGRQVSPLLAAEVCASAVVMLDTPCSEEVWRVLAIHSIRQFPLHFPSRASPCAIIFQLDSTTIFARGSEENVDKFWSVYSSLRPEFWNLHHVNTKHYDHPHHNHQFIDDDDFWNLYQVNTKQYHHHHKFIDDDNDYDDFWNLYQVNMKHYHHHYHHHHQFI
jgi:hypothetical protein